MAFDDVIPLIGDFGKYQKRIYFLLCLPAMVCAYHKLAGVFLQAVPKHRCKLPFEFDNSTYLLDNNTIQNSIPWDSRMKDWSSCLRFSNSSENNIISCESYIYDHSTYLSSTVMEWDMVCNHAYLRATSDALFMLGVLLGSIIFGDLSDRLGRKPIFILSLIIQVIFGLLAAFAPEYYTFTFARMLIGATTSGVYLVAYVIAMEMVGPSKRMIAGTVSQMFFSIGYMTVALFAYFIKDWRQLQIALTLPGLLFFGYWWLIPESTRWLLTKNRKTEAKRIIHRIAKNNNVKIDDGELDHLLELNKSKSVPDDKKPSLIDLMRYPNLRKKSFIIFFDWFVNSATYYGLSWNTSNLGGNYLINFVISGAVEIPAYFFMLATLNRAGRKPVLCGSMIISGTMLLLTMAVPADLPWLTVVLAMIGKLTITASYGVIYIFTTEQFPTVIRNVALGSSSMFARVGGIIAPYINLMSEIWKPLPMIIFGILAFAGGLCSLLLPETLNEQLPESIADGENFGKKITTKLPEEENLQQIEISDKK